MTRAFEEAVKLAGLPETEDGPVTFHRLRHTGISRLANDDRRISLIAVRDFAGGPSQRSDDRGLRPQDREP